MEEKLSGHMIDYMIYSSHFKVQIKQGDIRQGKVDKVRSWTYVLKIAYQII